MSTIDLNNPPPNHHYRISVEREESNGERKVRLFKDMGLFLAALAFVSLIMIYCFITLLSSASSAEEKKWAMSVLSAGAAGLTGYLVRK